MLRAYWFDPDDEELFVEPVDDHVRRVGEMRWHSVPRGNNQWDWLTAQIREDGEAELSLDTFYAGGYPLSDLFLTKPEEDPEGLWLETVPSAIVPGRDSQAFLVRDVDGVPTLTRLVRRGGRWSGGVPAGSIDVAGWDVQSQCYVWRAVLPLDPAPTK